MLAVRVADPNWPIIENLRWPAGRDELFYGAAPLFRPEDAVRWALRQYPKTFALSIDDLPRQTNITLAQTPTRVTKLLEVAASVPDNISQKQLADLIKTELRCGSREAQAYAALIRPDDAVSKDRRAARRRE